MIMKGKYVKYKDVNYSDIVDKIQYLCEKQGSSLSRLEREAGIGNGTIRKWPDHHPSFDKVAKVLGCLNISFDDLLLTSK